MNKLLSTSALAVSLLVAAAGAQANHVTNKSLKKENSQGPHLSIMGKTNATFYHYSNKRNIIDSTSDSVTVKAKGRGQYLTVESSQVVFYVNGETNVLDGMMYDWALALEGRLGNDYHLKTNRMRFITKHGTLLAGDHVGVESIMAEGPESLMAGTGGAFQGNYTGAVDKSAGAVLGTDMPGGTSAATKLTYLTPRYYGVQLGVSWTPLTHIGGKKPQPSRNALMNKKNEPYQNHTTVVGLNFKNQLDNGVSMALSAIGTYSSIKGSGLTKEINFKNGRSWMVGGSVGYQGFSVGAEWIDGTKHLNLQKLSQAQGTGIGSFIKGDFNSGKIFGVGTGYKAGAHKVGLGYMWAKRKYNGDNVRSDVYSATYENKFAPGLSAFGEVNHVKMKTGDKAVYLDQSLPDGDIPTKNNTANVVMIGTKLRF